MNREDRGGQVPFSETVTALLLGPHEAVIAALRLADSDQTQETAAEGPASQDASDESRS